MEVEVEAAYVIAHDGGDGERQDGADRAGGQLGEAFEQRTANPEARARVLKLVVWVGGNRQPVDPPENVARDHPHQQTRHSELANLRGRASGRAVVREHHADHWDEAGQRSAKARRELVQAEPCEANAGDGDHEASDRN